jgi:hypothetical protein
MVPIKKLPLNCPSCDSLLSVNRMLCKTCDTNVEGLYELPLLAQLNGEEQKFVISFLKSSGSIKEMASQMGMSYPTMRNMLDDLIEKVKNLENK